MSKSQVIAILFDGNSENIFYAGQVVNGHVHVETSEKIKIRGIRLEVTGKAKTSWEEHSTHHLNAREEIRNTTLYRGREEYLNFEIYLIGSRSHNFEIYLEPSISKYPFSFMLPPELPQSFEDRIGHIRYKAKAVLDRPMRIDNKAEVLLTVIRPLDLNREPPQLREPLVIQSEKPASGCCCVDGFAEINATINRGCFVPGETMHIEGEIANRTNSNIKYSTVTFFQNIEYCATYQGGEVYRTKNELTTLAKFDRPILQRTQTDRWNNISFVVPQVPSSRNDGCGIINIRHYVEISATFHECCSNSSVSSDVVIGNVALRDDFQPSVVTSQPIGYPMPYKMAVGFVPQMNVPTSGFDSKVDTAGIATWNHDGKDLAEVHKS